MGKIRVLSGREVCTILEAEGFSCGEVAHASSAGPAPGQRVARGRSLEDFSYRNSSKTVRGDGRVECHVECHRGGKIGNGRQADATGDKQWKALNRCGSEACAENRRIHWACAKRARHDSLSLRTSFFAENKPFLAVFDKTAILSAIVDTGVGLCLVFSRFSSRPCVGFHFRVSSGRPTAADALHIQQENSPAAVITVISLSASILRTSSRRCSLLWDTPPVRS